MKRKKLTKLSEISKLKEKSGITLIALVVTIVVLLILAGITINLVFSESGIIKKAQEAAEKTNQAIVNEQKELNKVDEYIENIAWNPPKTVKEAIERDEIFRKTATIKDDEDKKVTVPIGFKVKEDGEKVTDGVVIEDKNGNQFVWIPVDNPRWMYGIDKDGKKIGKHYSFATLTEVDGNLTCETVEEPVQNGWEEVNGVINLKPGLYGYSYSEPEIITKGISINDDGTLGEYKENIYDADSKNLEILGLASKEEFLSKMNQEFDEMIESVEKYHGFYIGRYETSNLKTGEVTNAKVLKGETTIRGADWYIMYQSSKNIIEDNNYIMTGMIWDCQYSRILQWLVESGKKEYKDYSNSTTWGNYNDSVGEASTGSGIYQPTGSNEAWKVNNIYDLAGNVYEWTMGSVIKPNGDEARYKMGGCAKYSGKVNAIGRGNITTPNITKDDAYDGNTGTRAFLCIK